MSGSFDQRLQLLQKQQELSKSSFEQALNELKAQTVQHHSNLQTQLSSLQTQLSSMQTQINIGQAQSKVGFDPFDVGTQLPAHPFSMSQVCNKISA